MALPGGKLAVLDVAYPDFRVGIEADSYRYHSSRLDWSRNRTRNNPLTALGWRILPVTWDDVVRRPEQVVALLQTALAAEVGSFCAS